MGCSPKLYSGNRFGNSVYQFQRILISYGKKVRVYHRLIAIGTVRVWGPLYVSWTRPMKGGDNPSPFTALSFPDSIKVPIYWWNDRERERERERQRETERERVIQSSNSMAKPRARSYYIPATSCSLTTRRVV